jgi:filamentous hemagglutinin
MGSGKRTGSERSAICLQTYGYLAAERVETQKKIEALYANDLIPFEFKADLNRYNMQNIAAMGQLIHADTALGLEGQGLSSEQAKWGATLAEAMAGAILAGKAGYAKGNVKLASVEVDVAKASKGTPEYKILNEPPPNSQVKLSNGTEFKTNSSGYVDELTFTASLEKGTRDARQSAVGKEGLSTDVGGHIQGCQFGGTCDRFNLFPQDGNFNNSAFKRCEMGIKVALKGGDQVGSVTVRFSRTDPTSARPDS